MTRPIGATVAAALAILAIACGWQRLATAKVSPAAEQVVHMTAKRFEYTPNEITVKKGVPVVLEITSLDRDHGFKIPEFGIRADVKPGETTRVRIVPDRTGRFEFRCDVFCGSGHEDMSGELVVVD
jgi:cytochrome c oxidase subunit II